MKILAIALLCVWAGGAVAQEERAIDNFAGVGVRAWAWVVPLLGWLTISRPCTGTRRAWPRCSSARCRCLSCATAAPTTRFSTALTGEAS